MRAQDDMTIKLWDWDKSWKCMCTFVEEKRAGADT